MKTLNSEREFEPHHRLPLAKTMTNIKNSKKDSLIVISDERNDIKTLKTTLMESKEDGHIVQNKPEMIEVEKESSPIKIMQEEDDIERQENNNNKDDIVMERTTRIETIQKNPSAIIQKKKLDIIDEDKEKGMIRKGIVKEMLEKLERQNDVKIKAISKKIDIKEEIEKERQKSTLVELVNKGWTNNSPRNNDSLKEKIDERLKSIERSMINTQNDSLTKLTKKIEILNSPLNIDRKRDLTVLNITESLDNEKTDRHIRNIISYKCKQYGHTKKQCDRHNKIVKQINKFEFEKDVINELMENFDIKQKKINKLMKKEELKSTNPLKINKRKRKQKDIIMKLIDNLPNHLKDKKDYLLSLKDSIDIPIACIKCRKYGHYVTECGKREKVKK